MPPIAPKGGRGKARGARGSRSPAVSDSAGDAAVEDKGNSHCSGLAMSPNRASDSGSPGPQNRIVRSGELIRHDAPNSSSKRRSSVVSPNPSELRMPNPFALTPAEVQEEKRKMRVEKRASSAGRRSMASRKVLEALSPCGASVPGASVAGHVQSNGAGNSAAPPPPKVSTYEERLAARGRGFSPAKTPGDQPPCAHSPPRASPPRRFGQTGLRGGPPNKTANCAGRSSNASRGRCQNFSQEPAVAPQKLTTSSLEALVRAGRASSADPAGVGPEGRTGVSTNLFDLFGNAGEGLRPVTPEPKRVVEPTTRRHSRSRSRSIGHSSVVQCSSEPVVTSVEAARAELIAVAGKVVADCQSSAQVEPHPEHELPSVDKLKGMKLADLRAMCKTNGLAQDGSKTQLSERILALSCAGHQGAVPPTETIVVGEGMRCAETVKAMLTREDLEDMKTAGLRKLCAKHSLLQTGSRNAILERLLPQCAIPTTASGVLQCSEIPAQHTEQEETMTQQCSRSRSVPPEFHMPSLQELNRMRQAELKGLCIATGLQGTGTKAELVKRLLKERDSTTEEHMLPGTPLERVPRCERPVRRRHSSKGPDEAPVSSPFARLGMEGPTSCGPSTGRRRRSSKGPEHSLLFSPEPMSAVVAPLVDCVAAQPLPAQSCRRSRGATEALSVTPRPTVREPTESSLSELASRVRQSGMSKEGTTARRASSATSRGRDKENSIDAMTPKNQEPQLEQQQLSPSMQAVERQTSETLAAARKSQSSSRTPAASQTPQVEVVDNGEVPKRKPRVSSAHKSVSERLVATTPVTAKKSRDNSKGAPSDKKSRASSHETALVASGHMSEKPNATTPGTAKKSRGSSSRATPDTANSQQPSNQAPQAPKRPHSSSARSEAEVASTFAAPEPMSRGASTGSKRQRVGSTSASDLKSIIEGSAAGSQHQGWAAFAARRHGA